MPEKQQPCSSRTGRSWILPQLHKIHSKNKGKTGEGGRRRGRKGAREGKMEGGGAVCLGSGEKRERLCE